MRKKKATGLAASQATPRFKKRGTPNLQPYPAPSDQSAAAKHAGKMFKKSSHCEGGWEEIELMSERQIQYTKEATPDRHHVNSVGNNNRP